MFQAAEERYQREYKTREPVTLIYLPALAVRIGKMSGMRQGRMIAKSLIDKRYNRHYCYFTCYGYSKGKCDAKTSVSSKKLEPCVWKELRRVTGSARISFARKAPIIKEKVGEMQILKEQLAKIAMKGEATFIKDAYMNGIDTMEESIKRISRFFWRRKD